MSPLCRSCGKFLTEKCPCRDAARCPPEYRIKEEGMFDGKVVKR